MARPNPKRRGSRADPNIQEQDKLQSNTDLQVESGKVQDDPLVKEELPPPPNWRDFSHRAGDRERGHHSERGNSSGPQSSYLRFIMRLWCQQKDKIAEGSQQLRGRTNRGQESSHSGTWEIEHGVYRLQVSVTAAGLGWAGIDMH